MMTYYSIWHDKVKDMNVLTSVVSAGDFAKPACNSWIGAYTNRMLNFIRMFSASPRWELMPPSPSPVREFAQALGVSDLTASILQGRLQTSDPEEARAFLCPALTDLHSPKLFRDMDTASARLAKAIKSGEKVVVYGDYDTDGVTATAILVRLLRALSADVAYYLPCRMEEGYGISDSFVETARQTGVKVVVTVDCGVSEQERVAKLMQSGIDVIVTDHHEPGGEALPQATAVVNPKREDATYPFRELVGAGVAFKLAWAVCQALTGSEKVGDRLQEVLLGLLPYAAVGTIADVAPLVGENRVLVTFGLRAMMRASAGLKALIVACGDDPAKLSARDIAFHVAPRLNAAGRMGDARLALELLLSDDEEEARRLALELDEKNRERQQLCRTMLDEARAEAVARHDLDQDAAIVVARVGWHEGVIGIVAGRLCDEYRRPVAVVALSAEKGKGSARSVEGVNLYEAMALSKRMFKSFGGHEQAAGFSIAPGDIDTFRNELVEHCREQFVSRGVESKLTIDREVRLGELSVEVARELKMLEPYGHGNSKPLFLCRNVHVAGRPALMGREQKHFSFNASQDQIAYRAVVFNNTKWMQEMDRGVRNWDIVFRAELNEFRGLCRLELGIEDMHPAATV